MSIINNDWTTISFGKLFTTKKGSGLSKSLVSDKGQYPCILYGELYTKYSEVIERVLSFTESEDGVKSQKGDLLVPASTTTNGKDLANVSSLGMDGVLLGGDINILRKLPDAPEYDSEYMAYYLTHIKRDDIAAVTQGATIVHLYAKDLAHLELKFPRVSSQKKIVEIIRSINKAIDNTEEIIERTMNLKSGLIQQLFTGHEDYLVNLKDSNLQIIDGDRGGNYPKQKDLASEGFCVFLSTPNVDSGTFKFSNVKFISKERDNLLRKGKLQKNDIVMTTRGTVGKLAWFNDDVPYDNIRINSGMVIIRTSEDWDTSFVLQQFLSKPIQQQMMSIASGSAQPQLPISSLNYLKLAKPPIIEQRRIAAVLTKVDKKIDVNRRLRSKLLELKKGLINDLFTGKVLV